MVDLMHMVDPKPLVDPIPMVHPLNLEDTSHKGDHIQMVDS